MELSGREWIVAIALGLAMGAVLGILIIFTRDGSGVEVSRNQYGDAWPFTVARGKVDCLDRFNGGGGGGQQSLNTVG